jgi:preprotein translocase subunit SecG
MDWLKTLLMVIQIISAIGVIGLVLIQQGKGADMGAAFGSGASGSIFGATGSSSFLSRMTGVLAALFFVSTLTLSYIGSRHKDGVGVLANPITSTVPDQAVPEVAKSSNDVPASEKSTDKVPEKSVGTSVPK